MKQFTRSTPCTKVKTAMPYVLNPETDRFFEGHAQRRVAALKIGDRVDLEADEYADPTNDNPSFPFEFSVVQQIEQETPQCTVVNFDGFTCGFPPDHWIDIDAEQPLSRRRKLRID